MYLENISLILFSIETQSHLRSSIKMVSIVKSRRHCTKHGRILGSTCQYVRSSFLVYWRMYPYCAVLRNAGKVDFGKEADFGGYVGVAIATMDSKTIDAILITAL
jgi:hypothetical protein